MLLAQNVEITHNFKNQEQQLDSSSKNLRGFLNFVLSWNFFFIRGPKKKNALDDGSQSVHMKKVNFSLNTNYREQALGGTNMSMYEIILYPFIFLFSSFFMATSQALPYRQPITKY